MKIFCYLFSRIVFFGISYIQYDIFRGGRTISEIDRTADFQGAVKGGTVGGVDGYKGLPGHGVLALFQAKENTGKLVFELEASTYGVKPSSGNSGSPIHSAPDQ